MFEHLILITRFYSFSPFLPSFSFYSDVSKIQGAAGPQFQTTQFVKNTPSRVVCSAVFSVFGGVFKHGLSCLIYYITLLDATV